MKEFFADIHVHVSGYVALLGIERMHCQLVHRLDLPALKSGSRIDSRGLTAVSFTNRALGLSGESGRGTKG